MDRAWLVGSAGLLGGGALLLYALTRLGRAVRFRLQRGKPYMPGSIGRASRSALAGLLVVLGGGMVAGARWSVDGYAPLHRMEEAARLRVQDSGGGQLLLEVELPGVAPARFAKGLSSPDWTLHGTIIQFPAWAGPLGLARYHRLDSVGTADGDERSPVHLLPDRAAPLARLAGWLGVRVARPTLGGRGELPEWTALGVTAEGYFLTRSGAIEAAPRPAAGE